MRSTTATIGALCLLSLAVAVASAEEDAAFESPLTGKVTFGDWSEPVAGLRCRLGADRSVIGAGRTSPIIVLQLENTSSEPLQARGVFRPEMLVSIRPSRKTTYNTDFQWLFERSREPVAPGTRVEAACRVPAQLLPREGEYEISMKISRGVYPKNARGIPLRHPDSWTGVLDTNALTIEKQ